MTKVCIFNGLGFRSIDTVVTVTTSTVTCWHLCHIAGGEDGFGLRVSAPSGDPALPLAFETHAAGYLAVARTFDVVSATALFSPSVRKPCAGASGS